MEWNGDLPRIEANTETLWLRWKTEKCNVIESKPDGKCNAHYFQNRARWTESTVSSTLYFSQDVVPTNDQDQQMKNIHRIGERNILYLDYKNPENNRIVHACQIVFQSYQKLSTVTSIRIFVSWNICCCKVAVFSFHSISQSHKTFSSPLFLLWNKTYLPLM